MEHGDQQRFDDAWLRLGGGADETDPVREAVHNNPPYRFVHRSRHAAFEVVTSGASRRESDPPWVAGYDDYRLEYLYHAEAGLNGGPSLDDVFVHRDAILDRLAGLTVRIAIPADLDGGARASSAELAIRTLLEAAAPVVEGSFKPIAQASR